MAPHISAPRPRRLRFRSRNLAFFEPTADRRPGSGVYQRAGSDYEETVRWFLWPLLVWVALTGVLLVIFLSAVLRDDLRDHPERRQAS